MVFHRAIWINRGQRGGYDSQDARIVKAFCYETIRVHILYLIIRSKPEKKRRRSLQGNRLLDRNRYYGNFAMASISIRNFSSTSAAMTVARAGRGSGKYSM